MIRRFVGIRTGECGVRMWGYVFVHDSETGYGHREGARDNALFHYGAARADWVEEFPDGLFPGVELPPIQSPIRKRKGIA